MCAMIVCREDMKSTKLMILIHLVLSTWTYVCDIVFDSDSV